MIDTLERFEITGTTQWALIRGYRRDAPVLLLVQQGPGFPMIHEASHLEGQLALESQFRVVYWDQRGTGKSIVHGPAADPSIDELATDVTAMVHALCDRFDVAHVHVLGFSMGGTLALLAAAKDPTGIASLAVVGPDVDFVASERFAYRFALAEAERRGNRRALRQLRAIGEPPHATGKRFMTRVKWVMSFGGAHTRMGFGAFFRRTLAALWMSPHYSLREMIRALRAMSATQTRMLPKLARLDLLARDLRIRVPLAIFQGRLDAVAPPPLAAVLAARLGASLIELEHSAHMPYDEEPERFRAELLRFIQAASERRVATVSSLALVAC